jgi:hypothetical protein
LCFKAPLGGFGGKILEEKGIKGVSTLRSRGAKRSEDKNLETGMI